ncbi:cell wall-active antibiotics response protein LiaF [Virgibacillus sp. C22-A2]|uniref:Cell wall-active antibiotics response protein LiaF n=1 Tax=Virgibacillus tibetensis TaxID=3042313 RepID=A0ABU6KES7_9BACI|nr:cell wall-active antibiotics response protein LiaF [Virgibacillus sp. C22-A2]
MRSFVRYFLAILLIALGVMLVLTNLGLSDYNFNTFWHYIYPLFFVVIGVKWFVDYLRKKGGSWVFGSFFLLFGALLLLDRFDMIIFAFRDIFKLWPLLIVYIGFMLIGFSKGNVIYVGGKGKGKGKGKAYYNNKSSFSIGTHEYSEPNWKVQPMNVSNLAGDFYFDFTKAFIPEKEIPVRISSLAGDVNIVMPENVDFRVEASIKAGEIDVVGQKVDGINRTLTYESLNYDKAVRKIDFTIKLKAGSIRIDQV